MSLFGGGAKSAATTPTKALGIDFQSSQYGSPVAVLFGQNKVSGNCIWYGDFKATAHTQSTGGGKGGGGGSSSTSYTYSASFELGLCEGPATVVNVYDGSSTVNLSSAGGIAFSGTQGQAPWSHLGGDAALGYSGTALVAFQNLQLGSSASLPNYNFEMAGRNQWGSGILDANPANIVEAICTDTQIGINFGALGDLTQFSNYCVAAGIFFSPIYDTQNPAQQALDDLLKYSNCVAYFSEGVLKIVPYCDETITGNGVTFTPDVTAVADLGPDDFITNGASDPVTIKRIGPADAMNIQRVEFNDRSNTYHTSGVVASIDQDVVGTGARADNSDSVNMITSAAVARLVAQNLLQRTYYIRNTYEFQLSWRYCYLEPMDVVTLTDANTGLALAPVRITDVGEDEHGLLSITAEEFPEGVSHAGAYGTQANNGGSVNPNTDPGPVDAPYIFRGPGFLTSNQYPEIWFALSADSEFWAGCDIYLSQDGTSYTYLSTTTRRASYGVTTNAVAIEGDPDNTSAPNVALNGSAQLLGGTQADADGFVTMAMLDTEIISYETAALETGPSYTLGYLRRGGYGSTIAAHAVGAPFVRLDDNIVRVPVDPSQIGQTVYLKFVSFNVFGKGGRTLADETAYEYVVGTNVELPDVPVTPADVLVFGVADGVAITWENPNPAAVHTTSIEYASSSTGPWTVLAQVGPTTTAYTHHFTTSTTYYYRLRSRGPLVSAGWSAYSTPNNGTGNSLSALQEEVSTISGEVSSATASAAAANAQLADIANPDVLTPGEKPPVIADYTNLTSEQSGIDAQATNYGITTQKTAYDNALSALTTYLGTLTTPTNWNDKTGNTTIVPATFSGKFSAVYTARQALLNAIYAAAQTAAGNAQSTANAADTAAAAAQSTANSANSAASAAQTAANNAQTSANTANAGLAAIDNPDLLTPSEKPPVITDYANITGEQSGIDAQATAYGITTQKTAYDNAVSALTSYLGGLTTPVKWNDTSGNTTIDPTTFRSNFTAVYTARQALLNAIYAAAQTAAGNAQSTANSAATAASAAQTAANNANSAAEAAQTSANNAQTAANSAQTTASAAEAQLADIGNDNLLTPGEKPSVITDYNNITGEQSGIDAQASAYGITSEKTTYDNAVSSLTTYLNGLTTPVKWNDTSGNTTITGTTFSTNFTTVYTARQALLNAIYAAAQALANNAQSTANTADANAATAQTAANNAASAAAAAQTSANNANSAAAAAQSSATSAENQLADIASAGILTPGEKPPVITDYANITGEQSGIDAQATAYGITTQKTAYDNAVSSLTSYLNGLTTPVAWNDQTGNTTADGPTLRGNFTAVYTARQALLNAIYAAAQTLANNAQSAANTAQTAANTANTAAAAAQSTANSASSAASAAQNSANTANAGLAAIANDGILSSGEKGVPVRDYSVILSEQSGIDAQAVAFLGASSAQQTAYDNSISSLTTYLNGLTSPTAWNDIAGNTTVVGATFRANFAGVYSARQALLNAIYAAAQALANAAQGSADQANGSLSVNNPHFLHNLNGWLFSTPAAYEWGTGSNTADPQSPTFCQRVGQSGSTTDTAQASGYLVVVPGQVVFGTCCIRSLSANGGSYASSYVNWFDASWNYISTTYASVTCGPAGTYLQCVSRAVGPAPANAAFARVGCQFNNHTGGSYSFTSFWLTSSVTSVDEVPDGASYLRQTLVNGTALSIPNSTWQMALDAQGNIPGWFTKSGTSGLSTATIKFGKQSLILSSTSSAPGVLECRTQYKVVPGDYIAIEGWAYAVTGVKCCLAANFADANGNYISDIEASVTVGAWTQAQAGGVVPANAASMYLQAYLYAPSSGTAYAYFGEVDVKINDLRTAGSGVQIGDQRNLPAITFSNYGSGWSGLTLSYSSTSTSATISASAGTLQAGSTPISYNASSVTVSGSAGTSATYYLYYNDPVHAGGSQTLYATTNQITSLSNNGNVLLGTASVTFPTSGSGSGTGGGSCPLRSAWVSRRNPRNGATQYIRAGAVRVGDYLRLTDESWGEVVHSQARDTECVRIVTECGTLGCSTTAPIATDEDDVLAPDLTGKRVQLRGFGMREAVEVRSLGVRAVQHITMRGPERHFWTGDAKSCLFAHHNMKPPPIG